MKISYTLTQLVTAAFFFTIITLGSCSKENSQGSSQQDENASLTSSESDAEAEMVFNEVFDDAIGVNNDVGMAGTGIFGRGVNPGLYGRLDSLPSCVTVTITHTNYPSIFPVKVVIDFGTQGCTCLDGHTRKGKIINVYSGRLIVPGAGSTTTFDNFYIDTIKVEGDYSITNTSTSNARQFTVNVSNAKLSKPSGNYTQWESHKTITQIDGLGTPDYPRDDVFGITGSSQGRAVRGNLLVAWQSNITNSLIKKFACRWIVQGKISTVRTTSSNTAASIAVLDFGNGDCDNKATVTVNGHIYQITLH
ncbi:MAG TPA: hypothetical protein VET23_09145 [Chitinophagaceae bacterium]|nr:hypothetical protein [Chitinophagaceae bacterium]